ncbi:MAG: hypothetical protein LBU84_10695 [Prevotella sp.]|jgi:hypothetical protein|nr:hypothetical protein [Prevotella sp.]
MLGAPKKAPVTPLRELQGLGSILGWISLLSGTTIAKERLDQFILDKVEDKWDDLALWEFYSWLLEQAKTHNVDRRGFISEAYKADKERAGKQE